MQFNRSLILYYRALHAVNNNTTQGPPNHKGNKQPRSNSWQDNTDYNTPRRVIPFCEPSLTIFNPCWPDTYVQVHTVNTSFIHFPFNNFRYFLTLFSKFFSSFLHSTCSLSVSRQYLALDGIYHPLGLQSQATRLVGSAPYVFYTRHRTGLSPSMVQDSTWIIPVKTPATTPIDYNSLINQRF